MRMRYFLLVLSALALTAVRSLAETLPACVVDDSPKPDLAAFGSFHEYRIHPEGRGDVYSLFTVDPVSGAMIGGLNACGDNGEKTYYRAERLGSYVVYAVHCGGWFKPFDAQAVIVFKDGEPKPVFERSRVKIAWGPSASIHSGPIKADSDDMACAAPGFDAGHQAFLLKRFDTLSSYLKTGVTPTKSLGELYRELEVGQQVPAQFNCPDGTMDCYFGGR